MEVKLLTHVFKNGEIKEQFFIKDSERIKIEGLNIWEGESVKISEKIFNLKLEDWSHGQGEDGIDMFLYRLEEEQEQEIKDATHYFSKENTKKERGMKMIKLTYTEEMKEQDTLWKTEEEKLEKVKELYEEVMKEAKEKGYKGIYTIYDANDEAVIELFENEEEKEMYNETGNPNDHMFGYCKPLIRTLEEILNKKKQFDVSFTMAATITIEAKTEEEALEIFKEKATIHPYELVETIKDNINMGGDSSVDVTSIEEDENEN